jgi:hypothetical protein
MKSDYFETQHFRDRRPSIASGGGGGGGGGGSGGGGST